MKNSRKQKTNPIFLMVMSALFAALIYVVTCYVKIPTLNGYVHVGDGLIFLVSSLLPAPYAIVASAIGGSLGDLLGGYFIWVPATVIIKSATAACFTNKTQKIICTRNLLALIPSLILCVGGYYLFESVFIAGNFVSPLASALPNVGQIVASGILYIIVGLFLDFRPSLKKLLTNPKDRL